MRPPPPARALPGRTRPYESPRRSPLGARAFALAALAALGSGACGDETKPASPAVYARNEAVRASPGANPAAPPRPATPAAAPPPRRLCEGAPAAVGKSVPPAKLDRLEAPGAPALGDRPAGGGRWLWVNLWAAWCGPCKEEIPRLRSWEAKLAALGTPVALSFITLDDDERQARRFLEAQPATGLRSSFWLPDGRARSGWLETFKVRDPPQLPMHFFFDPQGALRCQVEGAVEDADFEQVRALVARR